MYPVNQQQNHRKNANEIFGNKAICGNAAIKIRPYLITGEKESSILFYNAHINKTKAFMMSRRVDID
jgi:hypothetical protein